MKTYKVNDLSEETYCEQCGGPIFEGETVVVQDDAEFPHFCSRHCLAAFERQNERFPMHCANGFTPYTLES